MKPYSRPSCDYSIARSQISNPNAKLRISIAVAAPVPTRGCATQVGKANLSKIEVMITDAAPPSELTVVLKEAQAGDGGSSRKRDRPFHAHANAPPSVELAGMDGTLAWER